MTNEELKVHGNNIRKNIITEVYSAKSGHPGGSLSAADILTELYFEQIDINSDNVNTINRDRFVLSKGHASPLLYATLAEKGFIDPEDLKGFRHIDCKRQIEPILKERSLCEIIEPQGGRIFMPGTSKVDWMHMFEEQESSNLSISQYCKLHDISDKAFYNARSRYKKTVETPSLVAVEVNDDVESANTGCISFKLNGMSFEFDESAPDNDIQRIIKICLAL